MSKNQKELEIISHKDLNIWKISNLPQYIDSAAMTVADIEGTILYASGYKKILGKDERKVLYKNLSVIEPDAVVLKMMKSGKPEVMVGEHVLPNLGPLKNISGAIIPIMNKDKLIGGMSIFKPGQRDNFRQLESLIKSYKIIANLNTINNQNVFILPNGEKMVGYSDTYKNTLAFAIKAALTDYSILLLGETGVGKEMMAKFIHMCSSRKDNPFVTVNCAAIPETLLESELFGYEPGAFTGANNTGKKGKVEIADGGTLFLDEIGEMPFTMQAKLLRVLEEQEVNKIGSIKTKHVDIRIIAATNRKLEDMVATGQFRKDLFYRLNVIPIEIPPLRKRKEDIVKLCELLLENMGHQYGTKFTISDGFKAQMLKYNWPGNIRELENTIKYACVYGFEGYTKEIEININNLNNTFPSFTKDKYESDPESIHTISINPGEGSSLSSLVEETERKAILATLTYCDYNKTKASELLGITRQSLYKRIEALGIKI